MHLPICVEEFHRLDQFVPQVVVLKFPSYRTDDPLLLPSHEVHQGLRRFGQHLYAMFGDAVGGVDDERFLVVVGKHDGDA